MDTTFSWPVRVYIEDTDAGGIVYYANYLKYLERARTEWMRSLGIGKREVGEHGVMFVVHSLALDYKSPASLDDELFATARIEKAGRASITFRQQVLRNGQVLVSGMVRVACVEADTLGPAPIPPPLVQAMKRIRDEPEEYTQ